MEESCDKTKEIGPNPGGISQFSNAEQSDQLWEVKIFYDFDNSEAAYQHVPIHVLSSGASTGNALTNLYTENLISEFHHLEAADKSPPLLQRHVKAEPSNAVTVMQPKFQENTTAYEPGSVISEGGGEKKRRGRKRKQTDEGCVNEFLRTRTHLRYLLHRITYEQNLIDAYSAEGWKGQSVEKLKPEKELQHARSHILRYKLKIRDLFKCIDQSLAVGKIPESLFDFKGEINSEDIFCAKCSSKDLTADNDIILCDGACQRGFHQFCLEPPLLREQIPPGDESWLCPGCDCKVDCIHMLKGFQQTKVSIFDNWEKIFPEAAAATSGKKLDDGYGSPSHHIEDTNYDPDKPNELEKILGDGSSCDEAHFLTASENLVAPVDKNKYPGLPDDDSEDDDFDPSALDKDELVKQESCSSDFTSDSEDLGGLLNDADIPGGISGSISLAPCHERLCTGSMKQKSEVDPKNDLRCLLENCDEPSSSKRQRERLDYKKLNDETFGNFSDSSDEDFEVFTAHKRRSKISPSVAKSEKDMEKESELWPLRTQKRLDGDAMNSLVSADSAGPINGKSEYRCLDHAATQILFESFKENQYPERVVKENLAKELGLTIQQVGEWFDNTHRTFHDRSQMVSYSTASASGNCTSFQDEDKPTEPKTLSSTEKASSISIVAWQESNAGAEQNHTIHTRMENPVTDTIQGNT